MDFVVHILERFFRKNKEEAIDIMLAVHNQGQATAGIYPYQVAEMKVAQVMDLARANEHPLRCDMTEDTE
jgi:ATP-dependent Clp protease adaptor protein ClpS